MNLLTILEVKHLDANGNCLWRAERLTNTLHTQGQEYMLKALYAGSTGVMIPSAYYVGLDNRTTVNQADTLQSLVGEPTGLGYTRQMLSSQTGFTPQFDQSNWHMLSSTLVFQGLGGTWGPVRNAFLTTGQFLISTVPLLSSTSVGDGQAISFTILVGLGG